MFITLWGSHPHTGITCNYHMRHHPRVFNCLNLMMRCWLLMWHHPRVFNCLNLMMRCWLLLRHHPRVCKCLNLMMRCWLQLSAQQTFYYFVRLRRLGYWGSSFQSRNSWIMVCKLIAEACLAVDSARHLSLLILTFLCHSGHIISCVSF